MALSLTCVCGARFELDDTLAGQTITCPECQQPLQAPQVQATGGGRRTNLLAVLSVVIALVGAFTPLVGQIAAIVLGAMALAQIKRNRDRQAGTGLALFGISCGVLFGALMVFALFAGELFGLGGWWREKTLADQVDASGPLEYSDPIRGFGITRPSRQWAVAVNKELDDHFVRALAARHSDLLLVHLNRLVLVDVQVQTGNLPPLEELEKNFLDEYRPEEELDLGFNPRRPPLNRRVPRAPNDPFQLQARLDESSLHRGPRLDVPNGAGRELEMDLLVANQRWHMVVRIYRTNQGKCYIVRAYAPKLKTFKAARPDVDALLDSFKILAGR